MTQACFAASCPLGIEDFIRYTYDSVGNRTSEERRTGTTTYAYNAADQIVSSTSVTGTTAFEHDANGNLTRAGDRTYTYDRASRMTSARGGLAGSVTSQVYEYDGDGRRLEAQTRVSGLITGRTKYLWDVNGPTALLALERNAGDQMLRRYVHGNDLISMTTPDGAYYYHYDRLGSVTDLTDETGQPQWSYAYEPFGTLRTEMRRDLEAPLNLMRFTGELFDTQTGLYHLRARQYDPSLGRFLTPDPLEGSLLEPLFGTYAYADNCPTVNVDPTGLVAEGPIAYETVSHNLATDDGLSFCSPTSQRFAESLSYLNPSPFSILTTFSSVGVLAVSQVVPTPPVAAAASALFVSVKFWATIHDLACDIVDLVTGQDRD